MVPKIGDFKFLEQIYLQGEFSLWNKVPINQKIFDLAFFEILFLIFR